MSTLKILENEYPGDAAWRKFVLGAGTNQHASPSLAHLLDEKIDAELSAVLISTFGASAEDWLTNPCDALQRRTPIDVLRSEPEGLKILRSVLMRMP
ncbi:DUF2384 domain-containing protein [Collimonas pratensis]|uniref:MbcA/ParS/Xre antitoxin family protein n=1 Tax=Collimonas pratensis TaxID=279113 RepID=UPI00143D399C|nr:MbcA/ParS/Xre antitoxin family protein [Collimonas pratensis]NKI72796.1 DUF2384 domain-containing protein [Collimonas pratensis]